MKYTYTTARQSRAYDLHDYDVGEPTSLAYAREPTLKGTPLSLASVLAVARVFADAKIMFPRTPSSYAFGVRNLHIEKRIVR